MRVVIKQKVKTMETFKIITIKNGEIYIYFRKTWFLLFDDFVSRKYFLNVNSFWNNGHRTLNRTPSILYRYKQLYQGIV